MCSDLNIIQHITYNTYKSHLMSNKGNSGNIEQLDDVQIDAGAFMTFFIEKAMRSMETYVEHGELEEVPDDIVIKCIKVEVMVNSQREDRDEEITKHKKGIMKELRKIEAEESGESWGKDKGEEDDIFDAPKLPSPRKKYTNAKVSDCACTKCTYIENADKYWERWKPKTRIEYILKENVELISNLDQ